MSKTLLLLVTLIMGALLPIQAALNGKLMRTFGHPVIGATISFLTGTLILLIYAFSIRSSFNPVPDQGNTMVPLDRRIDWRLICNRHHSADPQAGCRTGFCADRKRSADNEPDDGPLWSAGRAGKPREPLQINWYWPAHCWRAVDKGKIT